MEAEFQLDKASYISHIDIGNCGSAFIEILVGNSMWPQDKPYVTLLPSAMLMSPVECKHWTKTHTVRMFNQSAFSKQAMGSQWDRVRVICRQPFRKDKQFGLSFMRMGSVPDESIPCSSNGLTPLKAASPTSRKPSEDQDDDNGVMRLKKASGLMDCLRNIEKGSTDFPLNRAEKMLHAALDGRSPGTPRNRNKRKLSSESSLSPESREVQESNSPPDKCSSEKKKKKEMKWSLSGDIQDEVALFLEEIDFTKIDLHKVTYKDLRKQMEEQRGCSLTKLEKKVFIQLAKAAIEKSIPPEDDAEDVFQECTTTADDTATVLKNSGNIDIQQDESNHSRKRAGGTIACLPGRAKRLTPSMSQTSTSTVLSTDGEKQRIKNLPDVMFDDEVHDVKKFLPCSSEILVHDDDEDELPSMLHHTKESKPVQHDLFGYPQASPNKDKSPNSLIECPLCSRFFSEKEVEFHAAFCSGDAQPVATPHVPEREVELMQCPICSKLFPISNIEQHADECVQATITESCTRMNREPLAI